MQYREALQQRRQEAVATAAIEALTKDSILHRKDVKTLVKAHKIQGKDKKWLDSKFFSETYHVIFWIHKDTFFESLKIDYGSTQIVKKKFYINYLRNKAKVVKRQNPKLKLNILLLFFDGFEDWDWHPNCGW